MIEKHIHKYVRVRLGKNKRIEFKCAVPGCVHHLVPALVEGRFSICNVCGEPFVLDKLALSLAKPHCRECTKSNRTKLEELFK